MKKEITFSVIIPVYNRYKFLYRSLLSVINQKRKPDEIIVVDDGSNPSTFNIVMRIREKYAKKKQIPLLYVFQPNKGVSSARNVGILVSSGNFIALLDSDDEWKKEKLLEAEKYLKNKPDTLLLHTNEIWIKNGKFYNEKKKHKKEGGDIFIRSLRLCLISPSTVIINKKAFQEFGLFDETLKVAEDYDLWLRITAIHPVDFIPKPLTIKYGGHKGQLSKAYWGVDRFRVKSLMKLLKNKNIAKEKREKILKEIFYKTNILLKGAIKRKNIINIIKFLYWRIRSIIIFQMLS